MRTLAEELRWARIQANLSVKALAEKTGITAKMLSAIEKGDRSPTVAQIEKIAAAVGRLFEYRLAYRPHGVPR
jgi:transcriptional regulator with XRE-family HTH domain